MNKNSVTKPIKSDEEVKQNNDLHIDQDFPGYPHAPSSKKIISTKKTNSDNADKKYHINDEKIK